MNVTMHMPPIKITGLTAVLQQTGSGPVDEISLHGAGPDAPFAVFRCLEDYDEWIVFLLARKAVFGEAQARHAARPLMPPPERDAEPGWAPVIDLGAGAVMDVLIDPDCIAGKHATCMGGPCTCSCHAPLAEDEGLASLRAKLAAPPDLPRRAPLEAPVGEPVCGARGADPEYVCTASPHGAGDHATFSADGSVARQWPRASEDATT